LDDQPAPTVSFISSAYTVAEKRRLSRHHSFVVGALGAYGHGQLQRQRRHGHGGAAISRQQPQH